MTGLAEGEAVAAHGDDRQLGPPHADGADQLCAGAAGHGDVGDDEHDAFIKRGERFLVRRGGDRPEAGLLESGGDETPHLEHIVDD